MKKILSNITTFTLVMILFTLTACTPEVHFISSSEVHVTSSPGVHVTSSPSSTPSLTETSPTTPTPEQSVEPSPPDKSSIESISSLEDLDKLNDILKVSTVNTSAASVVQYKIRYKSDDCEVVGYIAAPLDYLKYDYPVLIFNRGGNREFGKLSGAEVANFAAKGYVVLASQYRGNDGGTGKEQFGGDDINDIIKLIDISECFDFVQSGGVYMTGLSRGGMMTYIACRMDDRIKAATIGAGVSDAFANYEARDDMKKVYLALVGGTPKKMHEEYVKRSAVRWPDEINVPLLIIHGGEKDWRVDTSQSENMAALLEQYGKEHKLIIYENADHSLQGTKWLLEMIAWFNEHPL